MPRMHAYRCYLLDAQDHIASAVVIDCLDDDEAELIAREILAKKPGHRAIEVWDRDRRVYIHSQAAERRTG